MKKVFLFLLAASALVSCSSDDGGSAQRPSVVMIDGPDEAGIMYTMAYDQKKRLSTLTRTMDGARNITFAYNEQGKVSNFVVTGTNANTVAFTYDNQGRLATITSGGQDPMVVQHIDGNTMLVDGTTIKVDSSGDLVQLGTLSFTRESGKKGAFASVKIDPVIVALADLESVFFASKRPVQTIVSSDGGGYIMTNSYEQGQISGATFSLGVDPYTMTITY